MLLFLASLFISHKIFVDFGDCFLSTKHSWLFSKNTKHTHSKQSWPKGKPLFFDLFRLSTRMLRATSLFLFTRTLQRWQVLPSSPSLLLLFQLFLFRIAWLFVVHCTGFGYLVGLNFCLQHFVQLSLNSLWIFNRELFWLSILPFVHSIVFVGNHLCAQFLSFNVSIFWSLMDRY